MKKLYIGLIILVFMFLILDAWHVNAVYHSDAEAIDVIYAVKDHEMLVRRFDLEKHRESLFVCWTFESCYPWLVPYRDAEVREVMSHKFLPEN